MKTYHIIIYCLLVWLSGVAAQCQAEKWLPVNDRDLSIQAGSALDFSALVEKGVAGQYGRIIRGNNGHLAYSNDPNTPVRFFCASQPHGEIGGFPDHKTADRYARQVRLHGYNLARFHFVENDLMAERNRDFDFNPEQLDRLHYFLAALKREGVYWLMDGLTSWNGAYGDVGDDRWEFKRNVKLGVYFDKHDQAHWRNLIDKILNKKNPYTKLTPLQDPALMGVILVNEGSLNHIVNLPIIKMDDLRKFDQVFKQWLTKKYGSTKKAFKAWGESPDSTGIAVARNDWNASLRVADTQRFYYEAQKDTLKWMADYLRSLGYQGLITAYDDWSNLQDSASRQLLEWVDMHEYPDEPSDWVSAGSSLIQESTLGNQLSYLREMASTRFWFKPFTVSEYDQPFWDTSRYEAGLAMGAYGGFQDWDLICRHSGAIELGYGKKGEKNTRQAIYPFDIGMDPVARAGETLAALLFARQDVKTAAHKVDIRLTPDYVFNQQAGIGKLPDEITNLALVTGFGLSWQESLGKVDKVIQPDNPTPTVSNKIVAKLKKLSGVDYQDWDELLHTLKDESILSAANISNDSGIFQTDTGEIILNSKDQTLSVITDKTEAVAFGSNLPSPLNHLTINSASAPALFSVSSLDGLSLSQSKRLLLIYATDARNTGMKFVDSRSKQLEKLGSMPVRIKNSRITFSLDNVNAASLHLYALKLNGERSVTIPINKITDNKLDIELDLNTISQTPSTYFELVTN
jgi:hypothetical protein